MSIIVRLRADVAAALHPAARAAPLPPAAQRVLAVLAGFGAHLTPQHPGAADPVLASYFRVSGAVPEDLDKLRAALAEAGDPVEAAYVEPPVAPAG